VWAAEENPGLTGIHVHGYIHAGHVRLKVLEAAFERAQRRAGLGRQSKVWRLPPWANAEYFAYPMKSLADLNQVGRFLDLNRSANELRLIHSSNRFWRYGRNGPTLASKKDAEIISYWCSRNA
jgi:hypothetical protein